MCHFFPGSLGQQMIVDPARENRGFHGDAPRLRKSLHPVVQLAPRGTDLAFLVNLTAGILHAVADRLLVNIQSDVIHMSFEEPPWSLSGSTFPLSSAFVHHALLLDLAFKQPGKVVEKRFGRRAIKYDD